MIYGIAKAQDINITKVSRALNEDITLSGTHKRLCRNLSDDSILDQIIDNYRKHM